MCIQGATEVQSSGSRNLAYLWHAERDRPAWKVTPDPPGSPAAWAIRGAAQPVRRDH